MLLFEYCQLAGKRLLLLFAVLSMLCSEAWAQLPQKPPPPDKNYAAAYGFVALLIILGVLLLLRTSGRQREFKAPTED